MENHFCMTDQQLFDHAIDTFAKNGKPCTNKDGVPVYRNSEGVRSFVGSLIPDEVYQDDINALESCDDDGEYMCYDEKPEPRFTMDLWTLLGWARGFYTGGYFIEYVANRQGDATRGFIQLSLYDDIEHNSCDLEELKEGLLRVAQSSWSKIDTSRISEITQWEAGKYATSPAF